MAKLDDLLNTIANAALRAEVRAEVAALKNRIRFGLVYERHLPETIIVGDLDGLRPGHYVRLRQRAEDGESFQVVERNGDDAKLASLNGNGNTEARLNDLVMVRRFADPADVGLESLGSITRSDERPYHAVIEGENFHAIQALAFAMEGRVDCIYIDPPYNTGARDWKYNNRYVDDNDAYRHSKWLSFMEKRLRIAKKLLASDGVLVVTIDEHEVSHLGMLLEELFPDARRQMVTIVNNAAGVTQGGFYRVEEYAYFCFMGSARPTPIFDDLLSDERRVQKTPLWFSMIRYGGINSLPSKRPGLVYPIAIDPTKNRIVATGRTLKERFEAGEIGGSVKQLDEWRPDTGETLDGCPVVWPYRSNGSISTWQLSPGTLLPLANEGFVRVRPQADGPGGNRWSISYIKSGNRKKLQTGEIPNLGREDDSGPYVTGEVARAVVPKTVWRRARHDAGKWGARTLRELLGSVTFDYAKSPYAVLDTLRTVVGAKPEARILDFFAGSGTTLHSVAMLNAEDGGRRQCILVTNNQVEEATGKRLNSQGLFIGDPEFEAAGICQAVTIPRIMAAITGTRDDRPIAGEYQDGRKISEGFDENVEFFALDYLDGDQVELGKCFESIHPLLWLAAGSRHARPQIKVDTGFVLAPECGYAVLLREDEFRDFAEAVDRHGGIEHVFLVTDSEEAYSEMRERIGMGRTTTMLYRDFLQHYRHRGQA